MIVETNLIVSKYISKLKFKILLTYFISQPLTKYDAKIIINLIVIVFTITNWFDFRLTVDTNT